MENPACSHAWRRTLVVLFVLAAFLAAGRPAQAGSIIYVVPGGAGLRDGTSWANGKDLAVALVGAVSSDELWVRSGRYKPTTTTDRERSFTLKSGVAVYGGFGGTETARGQRNPDPATNGTILSGDLNGDDGPNFANNGENSYHVVTVFGTDGTAILDGFTISGGNANGTSIHNSGGGLYNNSGTSTLTNLAFSGNYAGTGGGMSNSSGSPTLTNVTFSGNSASDGAGVFNNQSSPKLIYAVFNGNSASIQGGGMINANSSNPTLANVVFSGNSAVIGGGMYNHSSSNPTLTSVTFSANSANQGGGMYNSGSNPTIRNSILWADSGGEIYNHNGSAPTVSYSIVQGGYSGTGNKDQDPLFITPVPSPAPSNGGNLRLQPRSPAIDAGNNGFISGFNSDLDGNPRVVGPTIDLGAYEFLCPESTPGRLYVNALVAGGMRTGDSWVEATPSLAYALARARACPTTYVREVWVARGTYTPDTRGLADRRNATFTLVSSVAVYGGFAGTETQRSQRDPNPATNGTVLSGDLNGDDGPNFAHNADNSYHVVTGDGMNATALLDGFTVRGGNANGSVPNYSGGGMYNFHGSPTVTNVVFTVNSAARWGGGMYNVNNSNPTLTNVTFTGNSASDGGGMFNNESSPFLLSAVFSGNSASDGAGMANYWNSNSTLINSVFSGNSASSTGGGVWNGLSSPTLTNAVFTGNSALYGGGGMYNDGSSPGLLNVVFNSNSTSYVGGGGMANQQSSYPTLTNVTFSGNSNPAGGAIYNGGASQTNIRNSILWGNSGSQILNTEGGSGSQVSNSIVQGGYPGTGNLNLDPLFMSASNLRLRPASPAINAGSNSVTNPVLPTTDLDGNLRILGGSVDMGAYEFPCPPGTPSHLYVNALVAGGTGTGESWANAAPKLSFALDRALACDAATVTQIWVARGTYKPNRRSLLERWRATFDLRSGLAIYGGFAGTETQLSQRNWQTNVTILSGDLNGDDGLNFANNGENSYHVVTAYGTDATAILDGFTITGGNANSEAPPNVWGGGMQNLGGGPTLSNLVFSGNSADAGGGMSNLQSSPTLTNVVFSGNHASVFGGGMSNQQSSPTLTNVTFSGNSAVGGGGMLNQQSSPIIRNSILWGDNGGEIYNDENSISTVTYSLVQGGYSGTGNLNADPLFVTPVPSPAPSTGGNLRLRGASPAINAGNNSYVAGVTTDLDGNPRLYCNMVDMGAYEAQSCPVSRTPLDLDGDGKSDLLWRHAASGQTNLWLMNGATPAAYPFLPSADPAWKVIGLGDFNADGKTDLLWRHPASGQNALWLMNGATPTAYPLLPSVTDPAWARVVVADLYGDRHADLVWRNTTTGQNVAWLMTGGTVTNYASLPTVADPNWSLLLADDLDGDSKTDLVWRNTATGENVAWLMNGPNVARYAFLPTVADPAWKLVGSGDFNRDGLADLVWRNVGTGDNSLWLMNGGTPTSYNALLRIPDLTWQVGAVVDLDGNGKADLVWRNTVTGQNAAWLMDGATLTGYTALPTVADQAWRVLSPTALLGVLYGLLPGPTKAGPRSEGPMWTEPPKDAKPFWSDAAKDATPFWSDAAKEATPMWSDPPTDTKPMWSEAPPAQAPGLPGQ